MIEDDQLMKFATLFVGNTGYHITCRIDRPKDKQNVTQRKQYTIEDVKTHLAGGLGLGVSPLLPNNTCWFAAIDVDRRDDVDEVDFVSISERVQSAGLPLVVCRSRSGGAHLYLFLRKPAPAKLIRAKMQEWADKLAIVGTDCLMPSADYQVVNDDGVPHISRSINLPYLGGDQTDRYAFNATGSVKLNFHQFLVRAEAVRIDPGLLVPMPGDEFGEAPPCVQRLVKDGVSAGMRNEALTQIAIYLKRVDSKDVTPRLAVVNKSVLDPPLKMDELKKIANSVTRRDYLYRCKVEPCKSLCDSTACLTRKFGIRPAEHDQNEAGDALAALPVIDDIARVQDTEDGGVYRIRINGHSVTAPIRKLIHIREAQILFVERIGIALPAKISFSTWYDFIINHIRGARIDIQAAEDTDTGSVHAQINDFIAGRLKNEHDDVTDGRDDLMQRRARLDTAPIREGDEVVFRLPTFERYCRDKRITLPATQVKTAGLLRKIGAHSKNMRTPAGIVSVWCMPFKHDEHEQHFDELPKADANSDY
jgi:Primase C terminal 1 (PriCT-1)